MDCGVLTPLSLRESRLARRSFVHSERQSGIVMPHSKNGHAAPPPGRLPAEASAKAGDKKALTWRAEDKLVLWDDATSTDCGYPSAARLPERSQGLPDGRILIMYYTVGSKEHPEWGVCAPVLITTEEELLGQQ